MKTETTFEVTQANEKYLFSIKQEEDKLIYGLKESIEYVKNLLKKHDYAIDGHEYSRHCTDLQYLMNRYTEWHWGTDITNSFNSRLSQLLSWRTKYVDCLYFTFGKYKGRIVQDIVNEDRNYCSWFSNNVVGRDFNTLKILDFLHKQLNGFPYVEKSGKQELESILQEYIPAEWHSYIDKEEVLGTKKYIGCDSIGDVGMSPWEEMMTDVIDYGDLC